LVSDLHLSFAKFKSISDDADVIVIAGDNGEGTIARNMLEFILSKGKQIVMIAGNHEYYAIGKSKGKSMTQIDEYWSNLHQEIGDGFNYLNNSTCTIDGQRFMGTTLWGHVPPDKEHIVTNPDAGLNDFMAIIVDGHKMRVSDYNELNRNAISFLKDELHKDDVLITHNAISNLSIDEQYRGNQLNCCYVCNISELVIDRKPKLAVHGHVHNSSAYMLGDTPVLCNPRGYFGCINGWNLSFDSQMVFDVDSISSDIELDYSFASEKESLTI